MMLRTKRLGRGFAGRGPRRYWEKKAMKSRFLKEWVITTRTPSNRMTLNKVYSVIATSYVLYRLLLNMVASTSGRISRPKNLTNVEYMAYGFVTKGSGNALLWTISFLAEV